MPPAIRGVVLSGFSCRFSATGLMLALFLLVGGMFGARPVNGEEAAYALPIRVVAVADVLQVRFEEYAVREYLDLHNDYTDQEVLVYSVTADSWTGRRQEAIGENWQEFGEPLKIPGGQTVRVAERQRLIIGRPKRNWWVRWIRFTVTTSVGTFVSNFISSPLKAPGLPTSILPAARIDSLSHPRPPGRYVPLPE